MAWRSRDHATHLARGSQSQQRLCDADRFRMRSVDDRSRVNARVPMEILRHPLYSILAVICIGALCGALGFRRGDASGVRAVAVSSLAGIGAAFLGFHLAMLSNVFTGVILFPFAVSLVISGLVSFALRGATR
jgi:hypothetical protein